MSASYLILFAKPKHLDALPEIERAAATIFPTDVLSNELGDQTTPLAAFAAARARGMLWVAVSSNDEPMGFAMAEEHGTDLHLEELDVHPQYQGQGIGTALVAAVCQFARERRHEGISLTTFSQIPWNAP